MQNTIYTIGYEGSIIEDFVATLLSQEIENLIDVRDVPVSRKSGFSKTILSQILEINGISYTHLKSLGDPKEGRLAARAGKIDEFRTIFAKHMETEPAKQHLIVASELVKSSKSCLLCFERDPKACHRSIVVDHLTQMTGFERKNLGVSDGLAKEYGPIRYPEEALGIA